MSATSNIVCFEVAKLVFSFCPILLAQEIIILLGRQYSHTSLSQYQLIYGRMFF